MSYIKYNDCHSGGGTKTGYELIYIEIEDSIPERSRKTVGDDIFMDIFGRDPNNTSCSTCGGDFSVDVISEEQLQKDVNDEWYKKDPKIVISIAGRTDKSKRIVYGIREAKRYGGKWEDE